MTEPALNPDRPVSPSATAVPDLTLVLARLETAVLHGEVPDEVRATLGRRALWQNLDSQGRLRWARLALAAGEMETAMAILEAINSQEPKMTEAWQDRLELLAVLDRRQDLARAAAAGRSAIGETAYHLWMARAADKKGEPDAGEEEAISGPFARLRGREAAVRRYMDLFAGREDCFARQWANRDEMRQGYAPVRRPLAYEDVEEHLAGRKTYGIYLMRSDATVTCAVIDADLKPDFRHRALPAEERRKVQREAGYLVKRIRELSQAVGFVPLLETSGGKGFHFWYFFENATPAETVRRLVGHLVGTLAGDLSTFSLEVFPKQDQLTGKGFGNLVKLPLGVHRLTGKRSFFPECADRSVDAQLRFLSQVKPAAASVFDGPPSAAPAQLVVHPRFARWAEAYPELYRLHQCCPPLGHLMTACRERSAPLALREEKILYQTIGFLPRAKLLLHHLLEAGSEYNPHEVDYRLSRVRGTPLGCRRIHQLLGYQGDFCRFEEDADYAHPLLHLPEYDRRLDGRGRPEKIENLAAALDHLKLSIDQVKRFMR
ncbi:MAG: CRISPR-associated primase-polymerase type A1 [Desulfosarcinaceae bacterium]|jgi:hypothetical protein